MPRLHVDSISIHSSIYMGVCMDIYLYLDTRTSERHRGARVGVHLLRVRPRGLTSALGCDKGTVTAPNASVCLSRACA
jgi:hypothetical protein